MNPFTFGNPIKDPTRFIGREADIRQITNRLLSSAHESTSIIGERRIGKTSLLLHLSDQEVATRLGLTPDKFCPVYVDFQGLTDITPQRFWQRIFKKMARSICDESLVPSIRALGEQAEFDLFDLEDLFEEITDKGLTTILYMDEFEYVTQNPNFKGDFFGGLRALAIHHGVALVPATRRELVDLCHSEEIKGSPFFNIFANVVLRPFSRVEVDEMICAYLKDSDFSCTPAEQDFIWELGGGYPFFVQMAGHYLVEGKLQGLEGDALTKFAATNYEGQAEAHFTYLWSHCSESEKITLLVTITLGLQKTFKKTVPNAENLARLRPRAPQDLVALGKRGVIDERDGLYALFSPAFERWIRREIMAAPGEEETEGSAEEWLKSGNAQNLKNAKGVLPGIKKKYWHLIGDVAKDLSIEFAAAGAFEIVRTLVVAGI
ncbi:MAG: AAA-like domain-containing protein [Anaerolineales bacterium]|nr:AAA-like domain-containing protein [Anaerolineales bacterium]